MKNMMKNMILKSAFMLVLCFTCCMAGKAGGEVASKKVEEKMSGILDKLGFSEGCTYTFNADGTYSSTVKGRTTNGTYTYNAETNDWEAILRIQY